LQEIESGARQVREPVLHRLAAALGVHISELLPAPRTLGERVAWWRTVRGLSRLALSQVVGMDEGSILKIEGDTSPPFNRTLQRLADALDIAVVDLVDATDASTLQQIRTGRRPRTREELHTLARAVGRPANTLLAMSVDADPFAVGTPAQVRAADWFKALWDRFEFPRGVHLRRIHYRLLSYALQLPDGRPYANTWACYVFLNDAGRYARILGLVSPDAFEDRRNPPPHVHALARETPEPTCTVYATPDWTLPHIESGLASRVYLPLPDVEVRGYDYDAADQPYLLEVWIEKSTMDDVLLPLCTHLGVNLVTSVGMQSITNVVKLLQRVARANKPARIFYISDFDPAGDCMPVGVARQAEFWLTQYAPDADIKLTPLALTHEQVQVYHLPRIPVKETDTRRGRFEDRYGEGAVELDALEALHPGELVRVVRDALRPYRDRTLPTRLAAAAAAAHTLVSEAWNAATDTPVSALDALAAEARAILRQYDTRLAALDAALQTELAPLRERLAAIRDGVDTAADALTVELPDRPEAHTETLDESTWLFDTGRDYLQQLAAYQARKQGAGDDAEVA
jgi:transcriptional regulator with XRE-family HTH domain